MCTGGDFCFTLNSSSTITFFYEQNAKDMYFQQRWNGMVWTACLCTYTKKTSSKQGKNICCIYVQLYLCSKVKKRNKNEQKKNTHQTFRSKCNNGLKWFVHTEKQNLHSSHAKIKRQQLKNQRWTKTYQQNTHTTCK